MINTLTFGKGNAKLGKAIATFSLPAGYSCPFALDCLSKADKNTGKITDGPEMQFRCFAASAEAIYPAVRKSRWNNFEILKSLTEAEMVTQITLALPKQNIIRVHVSGDYYNQAYFNAWLTVARNNPDRIFYSYTKALPFWIARLNDIPDNFRLTASKGGKFDNLISKYNLKSAEVVYSVVEAQEKGLEIDHDDSHAIESKVSFALLIHGMGPKGSLQAKIKKAGTNSYKDK